MVGKICGTGSYAPPLVWDNNDLAKRVETSDEWIRERTGIVRRHIAVEDTTATMASEAAKKALENSGVKPQELDLIIVSTVTPEFLFPNTACHVQQELKAVNATAFDLNGACTGFVFAYNTAQAYIGSGACKTVLVIGAESLSSLTNWKDRSTCVLFGDAAGAVVLKASEEGAHRTATYTDGSKGPALLCTNRHRKEWAPEVDESDYFIKMDGQAVFKFAVKRVPEVIQEVLDAQKVSADDIDYFIFHQANQRILEAVAKRLKQSVDKFPVSIEEYGNTSSSSIPMLIDQMNQKGMLKRGQKLVIAGFGAGLSWGAVYLEW